MWLVEDWWYLPCVVVYWTIRHHTGNLLSNYLYRSVSQTVTVIQVRSFKTYFKKYLQKTLIWDNNVTISNLISNISVSILIFDFSLVGANFNKIYVLIMGLLENCLTYPRGIIIEIFKTMTMWPTVKWRHRSRSNLLIDSIFMVISWFFVDLFYE